MPCIACKILAPRPRIEAMPPPSGVQSLNHWTTREVPICIFEWKKENSEIMQFAQTLALLVYPFLLLVLFLSYVF